MLSAFSNLLAMVTTSFVVFSANYASATTGHVQGLHHRLHGLLYQIESHYGRQVEVISGCRSHSHNQRIGGARESWHLSCAAADIKVKGINKSALTRYAKTLRGRGGVGAYCHDEAVHIDIGPRREWYWGCEGQRQFVQGKFSYNHKAYFKHTKKAWSTK